MLDHLASEGVGDRPHIRLNRDVYIRPRPTEEEVPNHAPDEIDRRPRRRLAEHLEAGDRVQSLGEPLGVDLALSGH